MALVVKNLPANAGDTRDAGSVLRSGRSPGGGHGNPLQYSCLENPMGRGAWRATVHGVAKSQTRLKRLSMQCHGRTHSVRFFAHPQQMSWLYVYWLCKKVHFHWNVRILEKQLLSIKDINRLRSISSFYVRKITQALSLILHQLPQIYSWKQTQKTHWKQWTIFKFRNT